MKKTLSKLLALALTASLVLSGCGGNAEGGNSEANTQGGQANAEGSDKKRKPAAKTKSKTCTSQDLQPENWKLSTSSTLSVKKIAKT